MSKSNAIKRLFSEYTDIYGRTTLYNSSKSDPGNDIFDSENQGLWTGETAILLELNGLTNDKFSSNFAKMMSTVYTGTPGLFQRQPGDIDRANHHNVSKDEYRGYAYGASVYKKQALMSDIIAYGESNSWFYVDDDPNGGFNKDHLGAYRLPGDRGLYKIAAGIKPNILELLFIAGSAILNSRKEKGDTSSKLMSWFTFKAIEIVGFESKILDYSKKIFDKNMKICYNTDNYIEEAAKIYFEDDHPFQELFKGL